ncbi:MAG: transcription antitermination factor NusB [Alphaproteobacteria bacterium]
MSASAERTGVSMGQRRRAARMAAVQALYQQGMIGGSAEKTAAAARHFALAAEDETPVALDEVLFRDLVHGVFARRVEINELIQSVLDKDRTVERLEQVMQALLAAGTYELLARPDIDARLTINEYVEVAGAFFGGREPGFANGVLDRLARRLRPSEMPGAGAGASDEPAGQDG